MENVRSLLIRIRFSMNDCRWLGVIVFLRSGSITWWGDDALKANGTVNFTNTGQEPCAVVHVLCGTRFCHCSKSLVELN